ncbi:MAG: hypothetical protein IID18_10305, partial [Nitrospinae bacterium]|nr:hypothetical protein [Nitrospinota bacterium]
LSLSQGGWARSESEAGWARVPRDLMKIDRVTLERIFFAGQRTGLYPAIDANWRRCHGMMVYPQPLQVAAFSTIPEDRLYATFEIPPFGKLGDPAYRGLREDRINCVYVSSQVRPDGRGSVTNVRTRRKNYIDPYVKRLQAQGAETIRLDSGILVILDRGK